MEIVFFVYGLAFFLLGFAILLYPKKDSGFKLGDHLYLIAGFGIIHGINEWLDLFILISNSGNTTTLEIIRAVTLPVSFLCLIHFGSKAIPVPKGKTRYLKFATPFFFIVWLAAYLLSDRSLLMYDILSRYLLCIPGAAMTAWGLWLQLPDFQKTRYKSAITSLKIAAIAFFCYSIIAGMVVKKADFFPASFLNYSHFTDHLGIPVQVFRSICAVTMAYGIIRALSIFYWETRTRIRQSELKFRTIATEAPVIIFLADIDTNITFIEGKGLGLLGLTSEEAVGKTVSQVLPNAPGISENCERVLEGAQSISIERINDLFFETCLSPLIDSEGETTGVIGVAVDVTRQTNTQRELEEYRDEMEKTRQLATLGTMGETMARQLGEPLAVAKLFLQRLTSNGQGANLADATAAKIKDALKEINSAIEILDKFYSAAHITSHAAAEPIDLFQIIQRIIFVFEERARHSNLQLTTRGTDIVPCAKIPSKELEQLFFIFIQNAIDNTQPDKTNKLLISCSVQKRQLELRFVDNCGYICEDNLDSIFVPFSTPRQGAKDSGLGLAIARRIIEAYDGTITVESRKDHGTTFRITLPIESVY